MILKQEARTVSSRSDVTKLIRGPRRLAAFLVPVRPVALKPSVYTVTRILPPPSVSWERNEGRFDSLGPSPGSPESGDCERDQLQCPSTFMPSAFPFYTPITDLTNVSPRSPSPPSKHSSSGKANRQTILIIAVQKSNKRGPNPLPSPSL